MSGSRLDRRVQFERHGQSDDGYTKRDVWAAEGAPVWASKVDISDAERWAAGQIQASVTTRFRVRSSPFTRSWTPKDRLVCEGQSYGIVGIKEIGRRRWVEVTAARRADQ